MSRSKTTTTKATGSTVKMSLTRFLQLNPQPKMVEALLKARCKRLVMTEEEWKRKIVELTSATVRAR